MSLRLNTGLMTLAVAFAIAGTGRAQTPNPEKAPEKPFSIEIIRTDVPEAGRFHRPVVSVGTNRFFFTAPRGFRIRGDEEQRKVVLEDGASQCSITVRLRPDLAAPPEPAAPGTAKPGAAAPATRHDAFRGSLLKQYAGATVTEEYEMAAGGMPGAVFDLDWRSPSGIRLHARVCFVPTAGGVFEFVMLVNPDAVREFHGAFNAVLLTFRLAPPGEKVVLPEIPSRS